MKYKVIMDFPFGDPVGTIITDSSQYRGGDLDNYPCYFAKYIGTTIDEVDIYEGDKCYWLDSDKLRGGNVKIFPEKPCYYYKEKAKEALDCIKSTVTTTILIQIIYASFLFRDNCSTSTKSIILDGDWRKFSNIFIRPQLISTCTPIEKEFFDMFLYSNGTYKLKLSDVDYYESNIDLKSSTYVTCVTIMS